MKIVHDWDGPITNIYIDSCYISGLNGKITKTRYEYTIYERGSKGRTCYTMDSIIGSLDVNKSLSINFKKCYLKVGEDLKCFGYSLIDSCIIEFYEASSDYHRLIVRNINSCHFFGSKRLDIDNVIYMQNSKIHCPINMRSTYDAILENNVFEESVDISNSSGMGFYKNTFLSDVVFSSVNEAIAKNNFFLDTVRVSTGNLKLYHNNFGYSSLLRYVAFGEVVNNNIHRYDDQGYKDLDAFERNNFSSNDLKTFTNSCYDRSPSYYDPKYANSDNLHINNPALFSRSTLISSVNTDIDGEIRGENRSIGADETCLSLPIPDSIFVECGTHYILKTCLDIVTAQLHWKPGVNLIDSTATNPVIVVESAKLIWLEDTLGNIVDSMYVIPTTVKSLGKRTYNNYCGYPIQLASYVPAGSSISWYPDSLIDNPDSNYVTVYPVKSMQLISIIDNGVCGINIDTIELIVGPPNVKFHPYIKDSFTVYFSAQYFCKDSLLWDFGDGTYSTTIPVSHTFSKEGTYLVTLTIWYAGLAAIDRQYVVIDGVGLPEIQKDGIKIFPNPTTNILNVKITKNIIEKPYIITDLTGKIVKHGIVNERDTKINVQHLSVGVYFLKLEEKTSIFIKY